MKREVERDKNLPSFEMDLAELEVLLERLVVLFDEPENVHCSIDFKLKNETLEFESVEEIKNYKGLKGRVTKFRVWLSQGSKRISLSTNMLLSSLVTVSTKADHEAWCAGAIETVHAFVLAHRTWYHWFVKWPFGILLLAMIFVPSVIEKIGYEDLFKNKALSAAWLFLALFLSVLYFTKGKFLPVVTLRISNEESFIRRKAPELSLLIALLTALLTVVGWFVGR